MVYGGSDVVIKGMLNEPIVLVQDSLHFSSPLLHIPQDSSTQPDII